MCSSSCVPLHMPVFRHHFCLANLYKTYIGQIIGTALLSPSLLLIYWISTHIWETKVSVFFISRMQALHMAIRNMPIIMGPQKNQSGMETSLITQMCPVCIENISMILEMHMIALNYTFLLGFNIFLKTDIWSHTACGKR